MIFAGISIEENAEKKTNFMIKNSRVPEKPQKKAACVTKKGMGIN